MKVILYMATTANGMIAGSDDSTSWVSKEEWNAYSAMVRPAGNLVVGHRTYDILTKQPDFSEFKGVKIVVVATKEVQLVDQNHKIVKSPKEALEFLKDQKQVVVAGGGILNAAFLAENLIDEIYLDVEPALIGKGIPLFRDRNFAANLELIDTKKLSKNEIQLHYKVVK